MGSLVSVGVGGRVGAGEGLDVAEGASVGEAGIGVGKAVMVTWAACTLAWQADNKTRTAQAQALSQNLLKD